MSKFITDYRPQKKRDKTIVTTLNLHFIETLCTIIPRNRIAYVINKKSKPSIHVLHHIRSKLLELRIRKTAKTMRNIKTAIHFFLFIRQNTMRNRIVFSYILHNITNTSHRAKRINPSKAVLQPMMTNSPPRKRTTKHNSMKVQAMRRRYTTLFSTFTISNLSYKKKRKPEFTITIAMRNRIFITQTPIFTHTVYKPTNKSVRLLTKLIIKFRFNSKGTEISISKVKTPTFHNVMCANEPFFTTFRKTLGTFTTRNTKKKIRSASKTINIKMLLTSNFLIMRVYNTKRGLTHRTKI